MNQRIMELPGVEQVFVFPNMGDGGVGVGAALWVASQRDRRKPELLRNVFLGPGFREDEYEAALKNHDVAYTKSSHIEADVADLLADGKVVARFDGPMEFGPRALCNRSILCQGIDPSINKWLNDRLKRTEFMPFAPISLEKEAGKLYENVDRARDAAQFMTITMDCTPQMKKQSPAAVHVDGTARPQLVSPDVHPSVHDILTRYYAKTGIPSLINTSFNMHEEPIVCSPDDAVRGFLAGRLDALAIGRYLALAPPPA
jgi:carbamoyltransferase